jgi:putative redox protein
MAYEATVTWKEGLHFEAESGGQIVQMDSGHPGVQAQGMGPMRLVLVALGGCTAMDVISLLKKMRQDVTHFEIGLTTERAEEHPKVYTSFGLVYKVRGHNIQREMVERAVSLSEEKYCSVGAMLKQAAPIRYSIEIEEDKD